MNKIKRILKTLGLCLAISIFASGCVNQHPEGVDNKDDYGDIKNPKVVATSMSTLHILSKLGADVVGVPKSSLEKIPDKYKNATVIGLPMAPDIEKIKELNPDWVFSPVSLSSDLQPKYANAKFRYGFLNLNNVDGMYKSILDLGRILGKEKEANKLYEEYKTYIEDYKKKHKHLKKPKVLILMGLPGSYVVATDNSYVGSLVKMAGGDNVYTSKTEQFINVNTEDMLKKNPDIILRTAHAMPKDVMKMFRDEFKTNDIWSNFRAVKEDKVYDLDYKKFGMSAKFNYPSALNDLDKILYKNGGNDGRK